MAIYQIPLTANNQKFNVQLNGTTYKFRTIYRGDTWFLDIMDVSENSIISGIPMLMGDELLAQYQYLISGSLYVVNNNADQSQSFNDLGDKILLYWEDPA